MQSQSNCRLRGPFFNTIMILEMGMNGYKSLTSHPMYTFYIQVKLEQKWRLKKLILFENFHLVNRGNTSW